MNEAAPSAAIVLESVTAGDRRRRMRDAGRRLAVLAPAAAVLVCVVAVAGALFQWPMLVTVLSWLTAALLLGAWAYQSTRPRPPADACAAVVDEDAGLGGELRSAAWFAAHPSGSTWETFHIDAAAERARAIDWRRVYPRERARGGWLAAAALSVAAFALPAGLPSGAWTEAAAPQPVVEALAELAEMEALPPELTEQLLELLARLREGQLTQVDALASLKDLRRFLDLNPVLRNEIVRLLERAANEAEANERMEAPRAADADAAADDAEWARENLASREATEEAQRAGERAAAGENDTAERQEQEGPTTEQAADGQVGEPSEGQTGARVAARRSEAADGAAAMMLGSASSSVGEPGSVFGGKRGNVRYGSSAASEIAASLKRETVEATINTDRSDLPDDDDRRRKTQQSWSALAYTKGQGRGSFDRERTGAVRSVPEARRLLVERYFIRPPAGQDPE